MIAFSEKSYIVGLWYVEGAGCNTMGAVWRDDENGPWLFRMRVRIYADTKVFNSADERLWSRAQISGDKTAAEVAVLMDSFFKQIAIAENSQVEHALVNGDLFRFVEIARSGRFEWMAAREVGGVTKET